MGANTEVVASAVTAYPEVRADLGRLRHRGLLDARRYRAATDSVDAAWRQISAVNVTLTLAARAATLAEDQGLLAADAIHLAAAEEVGATVFVSTGRDVTAAAQRLGAHVMVAVEFGAE